MPDADSDNAGPPGHAPADHAAGLTRRDFLKRAGASGVAVATAPLAGVGHAFVEGSDGTPEQVHLTWGEDPATEVIVSWAAAAAAVAPRVRYGETPALEKTAAAIERTYVDGLNGEKVFTYHARLARLRPGATVHYAVTADNDANKDRPFSAEFSTAPLGRAAFRFTSFGDLATPNTHWLLSSPQSRFGVDAVERFQPLFHLVNGDLCYANLNHAAQPAVWREFGNNNQRSAAKRPWMPCLGNHEVELANGPQGYTSYLTRYTLPDNKTAFPGRWYSFRIGAVLFIALDADDVIYQDCGPMLNGPEPFVPAAGTGRAAIEPGRPLYVTGYSGGAQTRWLEATLRATARDERIDWIIAQMHQDALSSTKNGNGSDKGIREHWLPLFDQYGVDLVLCGHDHDYERSFPVRGCHHGTGRDAASGKRVDTLQPKPVVTQDPPDATFDTRQGTIHLVLGGGGTNVPLNVYGVDPATGRPQAKVFTKRNAPVPGPKPGTFVRPPADAVEEAIWSAKRDTESAYGIAVFDVDPGKPGGKTTITMSYYHAVGAGLAASGDYQLFERIMLAKPRRDR